MKRPAPRLITSSPPHLLMPLAALALVLLYEALTIPGFFHVEMRDGHLFGSLVDILNRGAPVLLLALGMTLVLSTGGVDLSVGAVMAITGAMAAGLIARPEGFVLAGLDLHGSAPAIVAVSLVAGLAAGLFNGALVAFADVQPIVATLILMVAGRGVAQLLTAGQIITFEHPGFQFLGSGFVAGLPFPVTVAVAMFLVTAALSRGTALGLFVEAVGDNPTASRFAGVNARMVKLLVYGFCGLCAGIAGLIGTADIKAADANNAGLYMELDAILAAAIGGTSLSGGRFYLSGTLVGALLLQTLTTTILTKGVPPVLTLVVKAAVVVAVCLLQSPKFRSVAGRRFRREAT